MLVQEVFTSPFVLHSLDETALRVTPLCLGCAGLRDMIDLSEYGVPEDRALTTLRAFLLGPINFLDTSASCGDGEIERRIGIVLREFGGLPEGFVLATRVNRDLVSGAYTGDQVRYSVERSLRLLGLKQLQLAYLHDPGDISFEEIMRRGGPADALLRSKEEGLIAHVGVSGCPVDLMTRFVETGLFEVAASYSHFSLLDREADSFWDVCARRGVAAINAAPFGSSPLTRNSGVSPRSMFGEAPADLLAHGRKMEEACDRYNIPLAAVALQFSLRDPRIASTIVGGSRPENLIETVNLALQPVPDELWSELDGIFRA